MTVFNEGGTRNAHCPASAAFCVRLKQGDELGVPIPICTARAACSCRLANARSATSANSGRCSRVSRKVPNLGPRVTIVGNTGKRISRLGGLGPGLGPTEFLAPHGLAVDSHGDLYVGEVSWTNWPQTFKDQPRPDNLRSLHKFRKVVGRV